MRLPTLVSPAACCATGTAHNPQAGFALPSCRLSRSEPHQFTHGNGDVAPPAISLQELIHGPVPLSPQTVRMADGEVLYGMWTAGEVAANTSGQKATTASACPTLCRLADVFLEAAG